MTKISLHGFNNLTKSLSFSLYKLHYFQGKKTSLDYNKFINAHFSADRLNLLLTNICHQIGGSILNVAKQDYQPQGASATLMISEEAMPDSLIAHLDKSHLCIHTYPEESPQDGIAIFRADIELSTCGVISPLKVLDYVINEFEADALTIDFRIRGMTRDSKGNKQYNVDNITNISDHLSLATHKKFNITDHNLSSNKLFHTKMYLKELDLSKHLFQTNLNDLSESEQVIIHKRLSNEILDLANYS